MLSESTRVAHMTNNIFFSNSAQLWLYNYDVNIKSSVIKFIQCHFDIINISTPPASFNLLLLLLFRISFFFPFL